MGSFDNRWSYTVTAFVCGALITFTLLFALALIGSNPAKDFNLSGLKDIILLPLITGVSAASAAAICWPTFSKRTTARMVVAGMLTVMVAFMLIPLFLTLHRILSSGFNGFNLSMVDILNGLIGWLVFGTIFTFGIPYLIGIVVSMSFVDRSENF